MSLVAYNETFCLSVVVRADRTRFVAVEYDLRISCSDLNVELVPYK